MPNRFPLRLFAEALSLWALAVLLARRPIRTFLFLLAAAAFHPLMAAVVLLIAGVAFLLDSQVSLRLRLTCGALAALTLAALTLATSRCFRAFCSHLMACGMPSS